MAELYRNNALGIRLGAILMMFGASMFGPFFAATSAFMWRMEPRAEKPYTWTQAMNGTVIVACFFLGGLLLAITAYRPDRAPELTYLMNDISWIVFILAAPPAVFQSVAIGLAVLADPNKLLPRWMGYFTLWVAVIFAPVILGVLFKSGPFAWNGLFSFWLGAGIVGVWANILAFQMLGAIKSGRWTQVLEQ
ncbi:hypothetical protein [Sphingobium sp.]|uniref:hypothetical protein n=1 Tax=Sphingobium sp. TaxID=1912891 RepID=UPI0028BD7367|nr:hypothetical protein [Sphingobium sp.]